MFRVVLESFKDVSEHLYMLLGSFKAIFKVVKKCFREFQEWLKGVSSGTVPDELQEDSRGSNEFQGQLG